MKYWNPLVNVSFLFLQKSRKYLIFSSSFQPLTLLSFIISQCIKLISTEEVGIFLEPLNAHNRSFIFFAVNDQQLLSAAGGSHWNLLVFSKPENTFYNFDSLYGNSTASDQLVNVMKKYLKCSDAKFVHADTLQQNNGFDCGIHVLCNVDQVAKHICKSGKIYGVKKISYNQVSSKREELLQIIRELGGRMN